MIFFVLLFLSGGGNAYGDFGELSSIATSLGFKQEDEKKLFIGEIITADLPETTDKMIEELFANFAPMYTYKIAS